MNEEDAVTEAPNPAEIRSPKLERVFRGYDTTAVDRLLGRIAESMEALVAERDELRSRLAELEAQAGETGETQRLLRDALVSAQRVADELKQKAQREADELLEAARAEAREIEQRAQLEREHAESDLERLRLQEQELRASYRVLLAAALERLEERPNGEADASLLDALTPRRVTSPQHASGERS